MVGRSLFFLFLLLSLFACCSTSEKATRKGKWHNARSVAPLSLTVGESVPEVWFNIQGREKKIADFKGKVLLIMFWASWCTPCLEELPSLQRVYEKMKAEGLEIIAISIDEKGAEKEVLALANKLQISFPIIHDFNKELAEYFRVNWVPDNLVINRDGRLVLREFGPRNWSEGEDLSFLKKLLG